MHLPRPCIDCGVITGLGKTRCLQCSRVARKKWVGASVQNRRQRMATGDGAARRLRAAINRHGSSACGGCGGVFPASFIRVDHTHPLFRGGQDIDENVSPLCDPCHKKKTRREKQAQ